MKHLGLVGIVTAVLLISVNAAADDKGKFSGSVFGDFYYVAQHHQNTETEDQKDLEGENGFWFRRIYLTYDRSLADEWSTRLRLEMNSPGDFETSGKLEPEVKDAYLKYKSGRHSALIGLSGAPVIGFVEDRWGYRAVEKSPLDLFKWSGSRDIGLALKGHFNDDKTFGYHVMVGNGASNKSETNEDKKVQGALHAQAGLLTVAVLADYENANDDMDKYTLQGFAGIDGDSGRAGVLYAHQVREQGPGSEDLKLDLVSLYAAASLCDQWSVFGRVDRVFDPVPGAEGIAYLPIAENAEPTFAVVGVDYLAAEGIHFIPNVEAVFYSDAVGGAEEPDTDIIPRLTAWYNF